MYMCVSYYKIWILLLDWLARGMYSLVLCAEMEVGKSATNTLLSDAGNVAIYVLWEPKTVNPGIQAKKVLCSFPALLTRQIFRHFQKSTYSENPKQS